MAPDCSSRAYSLMFRQRRLLRTQPSAWAKPMGISTWADLGGCRYQYKRVTCATCEERTGLSRKMMALVR